MRKSLSWSLFVSLAVSSIAVIGCDDGSSSEGAASESGSDTAALGSARRWRHDAGTPAPDAGAKGGSGSGTGGSGTGGSATGGSGTGGSATGGSGTGGSGTGGSHTGGAAGSTTGGGTGGTAGAGTIGSAGNPNGSCSAGVPAKGKLADTSHPTATIGTGTAASCTFSQLQTAVAQGGIITFNCGNGAVTIPVTATLILPPTKDTVIDGGGKITLDGGNAVRIMSFNNGNFQVNDRGLTLQRIALVNGKTTPTKAIPTAPAPCSQGWDDGEGGALYMRDGNLTVIDSVFTNNHAAPLGPDTGGGAIYLMGSKTGATIVGSTFTKNAASNAGAVGALFGALNIYNSLFSGNTATGHDANSFDQSKCSVINNNQYEIGSGGNGAAIYSDGNSVNVTLCGDAILNNSAGTNAFGGGLFFTSDDMTGTVSIQDTTMTGNTGRYWTLVSTGSVTNAGTAVGINAKSISIATSTLQGVP